MGPPAALAMPADASFEAALASLAHAPLDADLAEDARCVGAGAGISGSRRRRG